MKMREILNSEKRWTQGAVARDEFGRITYWNSASAVQFCVLGALWNCYSPERDIKAWRMAWQRIEAELGRDVNLDEWNDNPNRTFGDIKALLEKTDL
jgi:hypothetical protein